MIQERMMKCAHFSPVDLHLKVIYTSFSAVTSGRLLFPGPGFYTLIKAEHSRGRLQSADMTAAFIVIPSVV